MTAFLGGECTITIHRTILKEMLDVTAPSSEVKRNRPYFFPQNSSALSKNKMIELQIQSNGSKTYLYNSD